MDSFRYLPPALVAVSACLAPAPADTTRLEAAPAPAATRALPAPAPAPAAANARFLPPGLLPQVPQTNPNQGLQNTLAAGGLGAVGAVAASNCLFGGNCDLSFRPSLGAAVDANGQIVPQLGVTTQVGNGQGLGTTFTGGLQLDGQSDATAQLGGNVQAPQLGGVQFNRPNNAFGVQPTVLGQAAPQLNLFNLFGQQGRQQQAAPAPQPQRPAGPQLFQPFG